MAQALQVLIVEDEEDDALLIVRELARGGYAPAYQRVETEAAMRAALAAQPWDLIISDYAMPAFSGTAALETVQSFGLDVPFIIVSGAIGEDMAVAAMKAGAHDYVMKGALGRLTPAVGRELQEAEIRRAKRRSERALRDAHQRLRALSSRMLEIQEAERRHLARELHDEIGQALTAVKINLQALMRRPDAVRDTAQLEASASIVDNALQQVRGLSLNLRPSQLDDLGLPAALRSHLDQHAKAAGFKAHFSMDALKHRLHSDLETTCFRVAQEALTNVARHARARNVWVELRRSDAELRFSIRDDGAGFDVAAARNGAVQGRSLGVISMEERVTLAGGRFELKSMPGEGTAVHAILPLRYHVPHEEGRG